MNYFNKVRDESLTGKKVKLLKTIIMKCVKFTQKICSDCLQFLVNNEHRNDSAEESKMIETLSRWNEEYYIPLGPDEDCEPFFSHCNCDLCDQIAGDRFKYVFGNVNN